MAQGLFGISAIIEALQNETMTTQGIEDLITSTSMGSSMDAMELSSLLSYMTPSQLVAAIESLMSNKDDNNAPNMVRTVWVLLAISTLVLFARLLVKWKTVRRIYWDDVCMISALLFGYLHAIFITEAYNHGFGRHMVFLSATQRAYSIRYGFISLAWAFLSPMAGRLGFCIFLVFVAGTDPNVKKWIIYVFIALQLLVNIGSVLVLYVQCGSHLDVIWGVTAWTDYAKYCWHPSVQTDYGYFAGTFNTLTDLFLTVLPGMMIMHTTMPLRQKIGLAFLLCLSILAMISSIVKTYESKALSRLMDYTYDLTPYVIWIAVEMNIVMTVASIPLLRPLFRGLVSRIFGTLSKHGSVKEKFESISLGSIVSKPGKVRSGNRASSSSQEHIAPQMDPFAITHTVEVSVTSTTSDVSLVHAALVGLVKDDTAVANVWH